MSEQLNGEAISYQEHQFDTSRISNFLEFMFTHLEYNLSWLQWPHTSRISSFLLVIEFMFTHLENIFP